MAQMNPARRSAAVVVWGLLALGGVAGAQTPSPEPPATAPSTPAECAERAVQRQQERAASIMADWPNLGRYREANARLSPPAKGEARVVFMGDSITDNWDNEGYGGFFPGRPYVNRGIGGQTTPQMLVRFRPDVIALRPKAVVILAGTNDIAGNTGLMPLSAVEDNLASMAELAKTHGIRVVLASVLPVDDGDRDAQGLPLTRTRCRPPGQIAELNQWLRQYAFASGHVYLDYWAALADENGMLKAELSEDGLHPNAKGYALMAPLAEKAIAAAAKGSR
jgi:lysophospholipase L1-like esterase